jgi:hypothetical protein
MLGDQSGAKLSEREHEMNGSDAQADALGFSLGQL